MKKVILLLLVIITVSGCYTSYRVPYNRYGLRPFYYSPRTHHGPIYKHPKRNQMRPHFNKEGRK